jgi:adenine C2-methylase RlmN of 23S rRNA A2503 and tRNA A37
MACTFCATGHSFDRHLTAGEIAAQVAYAATISATTMSGSHLVSATSCSCARAVTNYFNARRSAC